jgi:hypothetical protein
MIGTRFYGRMGNVLFQASHCIALALKHNQEFGFPNRTNDPYWFPLYLQHLVNPKWQQGKEDILINENGHEFQEIEYKKEWEGLQVVLNGYWQSEKYFKEYRGEILYLFGFPYEKKEGIVSCHVRRGDYLHLRNKHPEITKEWYEYAMSQFPGRKFKFFSDDIKWCRQEFGSRTDCDFSSNSNEVQDLIEMSQCEHNISSPSTFSWWGAWLNRNEDKKIYIPKLWFVEGYNLLTKDIIPESWIKL